MHWVKLEGDYWRSFEGRFDLCPHFRGGWSVVDGWRGVRALCPTREAAESWAKQQGAKK